MNAASMAAWAGLFSGGAALIIGLVKIIQDWLTGDEGRRAEAAAKRAEGASTDAQTTAKTHRTWFDDFEKAYALLEKRCEKCEDRQEVTDNSFRFLLEQMEDQIIPAMLPGADINEIRMAARLTVHRAREMHRAAMKEETP